MAEVTLKYLLVGEDRSASKAIKGVGDEAGKQGSQLKEFGAGLLAGFGGAAIMDKAQEAIGAASDLNETMSKAQVIFGGQAAAMDAWASSADTSLGMSKQAALEAAAGFGDMFSQIGFSGDQAAKMSKTVVQMSTDLGSFNNLPTADVADMISGAFRGEYDSLQRLIPNISAARVEQEALTQTHKKSASELTAAEKATAVLAIVQKDGARANGDFARTSSGVANQTKIQAAQMENLSAKIGTQLLPVQQKLLEIGVAITGWIAGHLPLVAALGAVVALAGIAYAGTAAYMALTTEKTVAWTVATNAAKAAQWLWNAALAANPIALVVIAIAALAAGLIYAYQHSATFRAIVDGAFHAIATAGQWMWNTVLKPVVLGMLQGFQAVATWVGNLLRALSHIPGFGWAASAADALDAAARKAGDLTRAIQGIPTTKNITITFDSRGFANVPGVISAAAGAAGRSASGADAWRGGLTWVGEQGPELVNLPPGSQIYPYGESMAIAGRGGGVGPSGAGGSDGNVMGVANVYLDGIQIHQALLRRKRTTGQQLGLA